MHILLFLNHSEDMIILRSPTINDNKVLPSSRTSINLYVNDTDCSNKRLKTF